MKAGLNSCGSLPGDEPPAKSGGIDYGPLDRRLGYVLRRAQIAVFRDFLAAFESQEIRPAQYSILTVIERNPGLKQGEVSEALGIKRANFVAMIDELEKRKLVRRDPARGDRRSYALVLTRSAKRLMKELHSVGEQHEKRIADSLGQEAYRSLFPLLRKLAEIGSDENRADLQTE
ncbi:MAG TPA: MarR family transcriptional regulator [Roseiarcus sp.]|nr:MarR family transcriptional regulator [Roseiarcus sp.]